MVSHSESRRIVPVVKARTATARGLGLGGLRIERDRAVADRLHEQVDHDSRRHLRPEQPQRGRREAVVGERCGQRERDDEQAAHHGAGDDLDLADHARTLAICLPRRLRSH
jgi:hypothetical protein